MKQNLHTHTVFCDGKDTPEELITHAISLGFESLGFSKHSHMRPNYYVSDPGVDPIDEYRREILSLKEKYRGRFGIFLGLEADMLYDGSLDGFDYLIGSVHYLALRGSRVPFDRTAEHVKNLIKEFFGGDGMAFAKCYYEHLARLPEHGKYDIIGHFDLITKHADTVKFFDETSKQYYGAAFEAAAALKGKIPFFEVNTGAISRGYRKTPYPAIPILKELGRLGFGAVITSDCHDRRYLDTGYADAVTLLRECGFREQYLLTESGFTAAPLEVSR